MYRFLLLVFLALSSPLAASFNDEPPCFKELKTTFFQRRLVEQALAMSDINQSQWQLIYQLLKDRSQQVPDIIRRRTEHMLPSPLDYPFHGKAATKILLDVLLEVFKGVMYYSGYRNESMILSMFNYIYEQQVDRFIPCVGAPEVKKAS